MISNFKYNLMIDLPYVKIDLLFTDLHWPVSEESA